MRKYIGKYRVDIERDLDSGDHILNGFTYLRCSGEIGSNGGKVYRYDNDTLIAYIPNKQDTKVKSITRAVNVCKKFNEVGVSYGTQEYDNAMDIYFSECDLDKVWEFLNLSKTGANIPPESIKNHPRRDEIRKEKSDNMSDEERARRKIQGKRLREYRESSNRIGQ